MSYEAFDIFGNKMINENERTTLHNAINSTGSSYWSSKFKDRNINKNYFVPKEQLSEKFLKIDKVSQEEWHKIVEMAINKCGELHR